MALAKQKGDTLESALDLWEKGFKIFPLGSPYITMNSNFIKTSQEDQLTKVQSLEKWSKKPLVAWNQYIKQEMSDDQITTIFEKLYPGANIGLITNGLFIVDADNIEAEKWCDENIKTHVTVRTARGKHYFFKNPNGLDYRNSANALGIDIRANGGYVVAPGSTHGNGHKYQWEIGQQTDFDSAQDLPEITKETYQLLQQKLGKGNFTFDSQKVKPINSVFDTGPARKGERNNKAASLTGALLAKKCSMYQVKELLDSWNQQNNPPLSYSELNTTIASIINTRIKSGDKVPEGGPKKAIWKNDSKVKPVVPEWFYSKLSPIMKDVFKYINDTAVKLQPVLSLASVFPVFATVLGQKIELEHFRTRTNIYTIGIGESGCGKNAAFTAIKDAMEESNIDRIAVEGFSSDAGLLRRIKEKPSSICLIDEIGKTLNAVMDSRAPKYLKNIENELLTLYSQSNTTYNPKHLSSSDSDIKLKHPNVSLYGVTTPRALSKCFNSETIEGGLLSRLLLYDVNKAFPKSKTPSNPKTPLSFKEWSSLWEKRPLNSNPTDFENGELKIKPEVVQFDVGVLEYYNQKREEIEDKMLAIREKNPSEAYHSIYVRVAENASKLALILVGSRSIPERIEKIQKEDIDFAFALSEYSAKLMHWFAVEKIADSELERDSKELLNIIRNCGTTGATERELNRKTILKKLDKKTKESIFDNLIQSEEIELRNVNEGKKGRPRVAYVALEL